MSGLTTHILDLTHGQPAANVIIDLYFLEASSGQRHLLTTTVTNSDGRLDQPLLSAKNIKTGIYELVFHIGNYFCSQNLELPTPAFLDLVPVRFGIYHNTESNYHVPLLISPYGYQVYRGS